MTDKVRIGLIGTSWWASMMYLPVLKSHPDAEIVAICGRDAERTQVLAEAHGIPRAFTDYHEMLQTGDLDGVVIATPDDQHKPMTLAAVEAGLHVLCEKPMALNAADAQEMYDAAEAAGIRHMVLFTWRWQPCFQYLKELVDSGFVGKPYRGHFAYTSGSWRDDSYEWRRDGDRANGILGDVGSHMIDLGRWLLGDIASVSADAPNLMERSALAGHRTNSDAAHLTAVFANGAQGIIDATALAHQGDSFVRMVAHIDGEDGSVDVTFIPLGAMAETRVRGIQRGETTMRDLEIPARYLAGHDPANFLDIYAQRPVGARLFVDAIRDGFQPEPGFDTGLAVQKVIDAALQSHRQRRWIDIA